MELVKCMKEDCKNMTNGKYKEYGTYCFLHSYLTHSPKSKIVSKSKILASQIAILNQNSNKDPVFLNIEYTEKKVKMKDRELPLPSIKKKKFHEYSYNTIRCCICDTMCDINDKMECNHIVCDDCLDLVRSMDCPCCGEVMKGNLLTPFNIEAIMEREKEDL